MITVDQVDDGYGLRLTTPFAFWPYYGAAGNSSASASEGAVVGANLETGRSHFRLEEHPGKPEPTGCEQGCSSLSIDTADIPRGAPSWVTPDLIAETIRVWQPYYDARLTTDDALGMIVNVGHLFDVLFEDHKS
jgi:hypothetical protein